MRKREKMLQVSHTKELIGDETKRVRKVSVIREGYDLFFNHIEKNVNEIWQEKVDYFHV